MDLDSFALEQVVRKAAYYLSESLMLYWPSAIGKKDREIPEANITVHLARAFGEQGFQVYAEANPKKSPDRRIDLLALHGEKGIQVAVEAKKLVDNEKAGKLADDRIEKIQDFELQYEPFPIHHRYGLLVGTTWEAEYAEWWSSDDKQDPSDAWTKIYGTMPNYEASIWGRCLLNGWGDSAKQPQHRFHHLLYCLFEA